MFELATKRVKGSHSPLGVVEDEHQLLIGEFNAVVFHVGVGRFHKASLAERIQDREEAGQSLRVIFIQGTVCEELVGRGQKRVGDLAGFDQSQHRRSAEFGHKGLTLYKGRQLNDDALTGLDQILQRGGLEGTDRFLDRHQYTPNQVAKVGSAAT